MEATPYTPPTADIESSSSFHRARGRWISRIGVALFTGPIWGMIGTVIGMVRAFSKLAESGDAAPEALANDISIALITTMIGISVGLVGAILILVALFGMKNREKWFFWWSVLLSAFWCLAIFPYGLIVGVPVLLMFIVKRTEFLNPTKAQQGVGGQPATPPRVGD
jgi:hypothetical protein